MLDDVEFALRRDLGADTGVGEVEGEFTLDAVDVVGVITGPEGRDDEQLVRGLTRVDGYPEGPVPTHDSVAKIDGSGGRSLQIA